MILGFVVVLFFCGTFDVIPTDSCNETEMFLDSFGVEEKIGDCSDVESIIGVSANPNGMPDVIKNRIMINDETDFN